jgi:predicted lipoprotein with Yx(FWY)xxD motif
MINQQPLIVPLKTLLVSIVIISFLPLIESPLYSEWSPNGTIVTEAVNGQYPPSIISDGTGGAILVWEDFRNIHWDIYAQHIDANGNPLWGPGGLEVCTARKNQHMQRVATDGAGGVIITWLDSQFGCSVYAQRISKNGKVKWAKDGIPVCVASNDRSCLEIASDGIGGAIIVWVDKRNQKKEIYAQRIDKNGDVLWLKNGIPLCAFSANQWRPRVAADPTGAVISWQDSRDGLWEIYAQKISIDGILQWAEKGIQLAADERKQLSPQIILVEEGNAIITWYCVEKANMDVFAQKIDGMGICQWGETGIPICTAAANQRKPRLIAFDSDGAIITWSDSRSGDRNIFAQAVDANGNFKWPQNGIEVCSTPDDQWAGEIISDGKGGAIITWHGMVGYFRDLYAGRINTQGVLLWGKQGIQVCTAPDHQFLPQIVANGQGGAIICWLDTRQGDYTADLYVQMIDEQGHPAAASENHR